MMDAADIDILAIARLFQNIPRTAVLVAMASIFPRCQAQGLVTEDHIRPILAALTTEAEVPRAPLGLSIDELFGRRAPTREHEIEMLYDELHALAAESRGGDPAIEARYQERLARLRALQEAEAREMAAFAEQRRQLPRGAVAALFDHIDALLDAHEHSSGSNRAGDERS